MSGWPRWLRMPGWPHGPLSPRVRHNSRQAGPHEASTRHPRCRAVLALCAQPATRSAGEGLLARCTQPRRPRASAACCGEARKAGCGEARAAAHNASTSTLSARSPSVSVNCHWLHRVAEPRHCCGVLSRGRAAPRPSEGAQVGQPHRPGLAFRSGNHVRCLLPLDEEHRTTG
ncbi:hypothetical protein T492DRAFT_1084760 [Pavlovales sp. CCMP2436]|nr:hypothetical protein T492DRAFT_1084760 [Pavlovales sp. CCMP2436]